MVDINQINLVSFCTKMGYTNQSSNSHGMKTEIGSCLGKIRNRLSGLNLKDFETRMGRSDRTLRDRW